MRRAARALALALSLGASGCVTAFETNPSITATEQTLLSQAGERAAAEFDLRLARGRRHQAAEVRRALFMATEFGGSNLLKVDTRSCRKHSIDTQRCKTDLKPLRDAREIAVVKGIQHLTMLLSADLALIVVALTAAYTTVWLFREFVWRVFMDRAVIAEARAEIREEKAKRRAEISLDHVSKMIDETLSRAPRD